MNQFVTDKYKRDPNSNALISTDHEGLAAYRAKKTQSKQLLQVTDDINNLKNELSDIKEALKIILERK
jgi:hypothetical protein